MPTILLVRHGEAAATYTDDIDPGLSDLGRQQAENVTDLLYSRRPLKLLSSPLKRAQETAFPLLAKLGLTVSDLQIEPRVSEIPSPDLSLEARGPWLRSVMSGNWSEQSDFLKQWRHELVSCLEGQQDDCVTFSHFVAINVAVGYAEARPELTLFRPTNASVTEFNNDTGTLKLVARGEEATTKVN